MAVQTVDDFLAILEKSKLVSPNGLQQIRKATVEVADAKAVAKFLVSRGILTRFQATQLLAGRFALQLGPYRLLDRIASSGTGAVYAAQAAETKQPVSLKVLPRKLLEDKETLTKLKQQVGKLKSLDHPAFCRAIELRREGEQVVLVLEPVEGESLAQRVQAGGPLPFDAAGKYVRQVAEALAAAHQQELVHGNVTPENLICDAQDQLKLIDVGTATLNPAGVSVDYAAPELSAGQPPAPAGDVYSLGCTLYFLLTGKPPFPEGTAEEKRQKHASELPAGVLELRPDAPPELMKLCIRMMAKKPEQRPELAAAVVGAIDEWLAAAEAPAASEPEADDPGQEEMTESSANEMTDPDVDRALAEAMAASDFDEHLDEPASQPAPPAAAAATEKAAQGPADEVDDVLAEAMAASEFDHAIEDEEQTEQRKARLGDVAGSDDDLLDDIGDEYEVESEPAAPVPEAADSSVATGGPKLLGVDLYRLLGVKEDDEPAAKKKKLIISGVASGVIAIGLVFAVVKFGLPMVFGESGKSPRRGSGGSGRVVQRDKQPPARDTTAQPTNGDTKQPADGTGDGTDNGTPPGETAPGEETPGDGGTTTVPAEDGAGTETPPDGTGDGDGEPGDGTGITPEEEPGTTPGETPTKPPAETPAEAPSPFDGLAASIDLPKDSGADLVTLGPINVAPGADCTLELVGTKVVGGGSHLLNLKDMGISDVGRAWIVQLSVNGSAAATIGRFVLREGELAFQWARGMDSDKNAQVLRHLGMRLQSGENARVVALQTPFVVPPVTLDFQRSRMSELVDLGWIGDPKVIFVEITDLEGAFPAHVFKDDKRTISADGDSTVLLLGEGDDQILSMNLEASVSEKLTLSVNAFAKLASEENSFVFNEGSAKSWGNRVNQDLRETKKKLADVKQRASDAGSIRSLVEKQKQRIAELEAEQQALQESLRQLTNLSKLALGLQDKGKIHFRIFYRVGEHEINLIKTQE